MSDIKNTPGRLPDPPLRLIFFRIFSQIPDVIFRWHKFRCDKHIGLGLLHGVSDWIIGQLGINLRRGRRLMSEDLADDMQALIAHCHVTTRGAAIMPSSA